MADFRDILGVSKQSQGDLQLQQRPKQEKVKRPDGMSREAYALYLDSTHPYMQTHIKEEMLRTKNQEGEQKQIQGKKSSFKGVVTWQWREFNNQARNDNLQLRHWTKCLKDRNNHLREAEEGEYPFAKFNKKVPVYKYTDKEYDSLIAQESINWTKEESDYLIDLCELFDLRFVVVADRYEYQIKDSREVVRRPIEDIKDRYFQISKILLAAREGGELVLKNNPLFRNPYNKQNEQKRRNALDQCFTRTAQVLREEQEILEKAAQVDEKRKYVLQQKRQNQLKQQEMKKQVEEQKRWAQDQQQNTNQQEQVKTKYAKGIPVLQLGQDIGSMPGFMYPSDFKECSEAIYYQPTLLDATMTAKPLQAGVYVRGHLVRNEKDLITQSSNQGTTRNQMQKMLNQTMEQISLKDYNLNINSRSVTNCLLAVYLEAMKYQKEKKKIQNLNAISIQGEGSMQSNPKRISLKKKGPRRNTQQ